MVNRIWTGRLAAAAVVLLLFGGWRPFPTSSSPFVLRSSPKGPRRNLPELPATSAVRANRSDLRQAPLPRVAAGECPDRGGFAFLAPSTRARVSGLLTRPRALQSYAPRDAQNPLAPPSA